MSQLPPEAGETHVWLLRPEQVPPEGLAACRSLLSPEEVARHDRFWFERDRVTFGVAHALVRTSLAACVGLDPLELRFSAGEHGKPELAGPKGALGLRFNLSHTRGLVAVAICCDTRVGIDVEDRTRRSSTVRIARRFFAPAEVEALLAVPEAEQRRHFFRLWTLKEAYLKACGLGLAIPLGDFAFTLGPMGSPVGLGFAPRRQDEPAAWQLEEREPTEDHALALALRTGGRPPHRVVIRWADLPQGEASGRIRPA